MKILIRLFLFTAFMALSTSLLQAQSKYKCLIQMNSYMGDAAYITVSLINSKGAYEKTLYVLGADKKWYKSLKEWNKFYLKHPDVSAVTGASISGGDRTMKVLEIEDAKINSGYKIRFESAVEDKQYHAQDVEIPLTTETLNGKSDGTGYIKYVRFSKVP